MYHGAYGQRNPSEVARQQAARCNSGCPSMDVTKLDVSRQIKVGLCLQLTVLVHAAMTAGLLALTASSAYASVTNPVAVFPTCVLFSHV